VANGEEENMFGEFIKKRRVSRGITLREFCRKLNMDASNWSKVERGFLSPPQDEAKLKEIAYFLEIPINSKLWGELKDMANIDAGLIPKDILSDKEIVNSLPMFFRTIRSDKPMLEELDVLINLLRKG
jgi:transcriptional regulator with XRE-family HTH domain